MINFEFPRALGVEVNGRTALLLDESCATLGDALTALRQRAPEVLDRVMDETGAIRPHVNIFVDDENIRFLDGVDTRLNDSSTILILAAISGG